jgi:cytoskeletal protein RodZ
VEITQTGWKNHYLLIGDYFFRLTNSQLFHRSRVMNRLIPLIGMMVLVAALTGAAIGWMGWRSPFSGRRASNQLDATTQNKQATGTQNLRANQPATKTAQNSQTQKLGANQSATTTQNTTAQAPKGADTSGTAAAQSDASQPVPALW